MMNRKFLILLLAFLAPMAMAAGDFDLWKTGRSFYWDENWEKAAENFQKLVDGYPESRFRCKSGYFLGYCLDKMGRHKEAFERFTWVVEQNNCRNETVEDAKAKRQQLAYEFAKTDPAYKKVLIDDLQDGNADIRLSSAMWLAILEDRAGLPVLFDVVENDGDKDRRDNASRHILKVGNDEDKARLETILETKKSDAGGKPTMVRLIIRDLSKNEDTVRINLPIELFNVVVKSLSEEQLDQINERAGVNLRNFNFDLDSLPSGKVLFKIIDGDQQEIKLFLE